MHSPEQNSEAELKNHALMGMVNCILLEADVSDKFCAATYQQSTLPTKASQETPFKLWYRHKPSVKYLRVFRSKVYAGLNKKTP